LRKALNFLAFNTIWKKFTEDMGRERREGRRRNAKEGKGVNEEGDALSFDRFRSKKGREDSSWRKEGGAEGGREEFTKGGDGSNFCRKRIFTLLVRGKRKKNRAMGGM